MKQIFFLTGEHIELAKEEVLALTKSEDYVLKDRILITECSEDLSNRLAFTHSIYQFLFKTTFNDLKQAINDFDFLSHYEDDFCVRLNSLKESPKISESKLADLVWIRLQKQLVNQVNKEEQKELKPNVNLVNSNCIFEFFISNEEVFVGKKINDINKDFFDRWPHKRPCFHPTSITSKLARCCVNLSGIKDKILYDPFCGIGAILIEAGMMDIRCKGSDLSENKLEMAKKNLDHYDINSTLTKQDALKLPQAEYDVIVTDPPYDKNEKVQMPLDKFYRSFLLSAYNSLRKDGILVMISPDKIQFENLNPGFKIKTSIKWFVHGSLTRRILVLKKR